MGLTLERERQGPSASLLPEPEDIFVSWLMSVPSGADLVAAADIEIIRLMQYTGSHPGPARLAALFRGFRRSLAPSRSRSRLQ